MLPVCAPARACLTRSLPQAYMQEVASYQAGERDYTKLRGDTGASRPRLGSRCGR